jgi:hypothetical protein
MKKITYIWLLVALAIIIGAAAYSSRVFVEGIQVGVNGSPQDSAKVVASNFVFYSGGVAYSTGGGSTDSTWVVIRVDSIWNATDGEGVMIEGVTIEDYVITLPVGTGILSFGDGDTEIKLSPDDQLRITVGATLNWLMEPSLNVSYRSIEPSGTGLFLGGGTEFWSRIYGEIIYIGDVNSDIRLDGSGNMSFTDQTGTYTLTQLAAGGGGSYTFGNGITESGGNVDLGSILTGDITWETEVATRGIILDFHDAAYDIFGDNKFSANQFKWQQYDDPNETGHILNLSNLGGSSILEIGIREGMTPDLWMKMNFSAAGGMVITDLVDSTGFKYAGNYDTNGILDDNWLPSWRAIKAYADAVTGDSLSQVYAWYQAAVPLDTSVVLKADTIVMFKVRAGFGEVVDTLISTTEGYYYDFISFKDSTVLTELVVFADSAGLGATPAFSIQGSFSLSLATAGTNIFSSAQAVAGSEPVTTGERFTTFSNQIIPPGDYIIRFNLSSITAKFTMIMIVGKGYYLNAT